MTNEVTITQLVRIVQAADRAEMLLRGARIGHEDDQGSEDLGEALQTLTMALEPFREACEFGEDDKSKYKKFHLVIDANSRLT